MQGLPRAAMWVVFGVVVAVALSAGAFAVANGSIGEPAGPVSVSPQDTGKQASETDGPSASLRPTPSASPSKHDHDGGGSQGPGSSSSTTSTVTNTYSPTSSPSHDDHGDDGQDD